MKKLVIFRRRLLAAVVTTLLVLTGPAAAVGWDDVEAEPLPRTGGELAALTLGLILLAFGGGALYLTRRRR